MYILARKTIVFMNPTIKKAYPRGGVSKRISLKNINI